MIIEVGLARGNAVAGFEFLSWTNSSLTKCKCATLGEVNCIRGLQYSFADTHTSPLLFSLLCIAISTAIRVLFIPLIDDDDDDDKRQ